MSGIPQVLYVEMEITPEKGEARYMRTSESVVDALMQQMDDKRKYPSSSWKVAEYRLVGEMHATITLTPVREEQDNGQ